MTKEVKKGIDSKYVLLYVGMASMVMFFTSLMSAMLVKRGDIAHWKDVVIPSSFFISTLVIILSSFTIDAVKRYAEKSVSKTYLFSIITLILSFVFLALQYNGWQQLKAEGVFLVGNSSGSFIYMVSFLHGLHYIFGIFFLLRFMWRYYWNKNDFRSHSYMSIDILSQYWHFIGIVWVILYLFFKFVIYN